MILRRIFRKKKKSSHEFVRYLRKCGVDIGDGTYFFDPNHVSIDLQRPWMIKIGRFCKITRGVSILQHDYSRSVLRMAFGEIIPESKPTKIGDNVFLGLNSTVLMGAEIGNNVIIGANSVISGKIPENTVVAGNPGKVIMSLNDYYKKRLNRYIDEGVTQAIYFYLSKGSWPSKFEMGTFFVLYEERSMSKIEELKEEGIFRFNGDDEDDLIRVYLESKAPFQNYEDFISHCRIRLEEQGHKK